MHILLVDDDAELCSLLSEFLRREGFTVDSEHDGNRGLAHASEPGIDLVVLDVMLPGIDGFEILRRLRVNHKVPVIMLTARGEDVDRIVGLELGADDYLAKPFHPRELLARIRAILSRAQMSEIPSEVAEYRFEGLSLDLIRRVLTREDGSRVPLSGAEFELLAIFLARPNRVLSRDMLVELTQGREAPAYDRSIDVRVSRLRQSLADSSNPRLLQTVYGEGYVLTANVEAVRWGTRHESAQPHAQ